MCILTRSRRYAQILLVLLLGECSARLLGRHSGAVRASMRTDVRHRHHGAADEHRRIGRVHYPRGAA